MKTTTITRVTCALDNLTLGWWNEEKEEYIPIRTDDDIKVASAILGCSAELLNILVMLTESTKGLVGTDLRAIWKRLDKAGI